MDEEIFDFSLLKKNLLNIEENNQERIVIIYWVILLLHDCWGRKENTYDGNNSGKNTQHRFIYLIHLSSYFSE